MLRANLSCNALVIQKLWKYSLLQGVHYNVGMPFHAVVFLHYIQLFGIDCTW